jgi:dienelactone hydrolase
MPRVSQYGAWTSPITADLTAASAISLITAAVDGPDIYWIESHPNEGGRYTVVRRQPNGSLNECTPSGFYVRSTVHEYGGGAFTVSDGVIYFVNFKDQHLYRQPLGKQPKLLTPGDGCRYADIVLDTRRNRLVCVREDHRGVGQAVNTIVGVSEEGDNNGQVLTAGNDFYSSPRLSPDGARLAYLTWNHPHMPWDGCELWVAEIDTAGVLNAPRLIAGGIRESIFQPEWSPDGVLHFASDRTGWWNLYRMNGSRTEALCPMEAEFGKPQWQFGASLYGFASASTILCSYAQNGFSHLAWLDTVSGRLTPVKSSYSEISDVHCGDGFAVFLAGAPMLPSAVVRMDFPGCEIQPLKQSRESAVDPAYFSIPETLDFPTESGLQSHAFHYPPRNPDFQAPAGELPPLIVISHGGPTGATSTTLRYSIQFWTSRGFAVLDVNYGGSAGYGRAYRERLNGQWGVVDVDDCCNGALYLAKAGRADCNRLVIRGSSAGGYTTLACLAFRNDVFRAGASQYGLGDLERFIEDTHKFESRYLTSLIGPYPERWDLYYERSPIHFIQNFACPLILFQGDEDKIVPASQSQMMFDAVRAKGLPVAYLLFEGEQHGFRQAKNIKRALEAELYFYSKVFGFAAADPIEPIVIENL